MRGALSVQCPSSEAMRRPNSALASSKALMSANREFGHHVDAAATTAYSAAKEFTA
jgi:hypothetical protein